MLRPAAGRLITGRSVAELTGTHVDLDEIARLDARDLVAEIREAMMPDPGDAAGHAVAIEALERRLGAYVPVDEPGLMINELVNDFRTVTGMTPGAYLDDQPQPRIDPPGRS